MMRYMRAIQTISMAAFLVGGLAGLPGGLSGQDATPLRLEDAIRTALSRSPAMQQAEAEILRGRASRTDGFGRLMPTLNFSTGLNQSQILQRTATDPITGGIVQLPDSLIERRQTYATQQVISANWTVFDGGRRWDDAAAGRSRARAAEYSADAARGRLAAEVTIAFLDALDAAALVEVRRAELERARELERTAEARFKVGEVPELDWLQARLTASEAEIALLDAETEARLAKLFLTERMGAPVGREYELVAPEPWESGLTEDEIRERARRGSPVLAEARQRVQAADRDSRSLARELLPTVTVGANWIRSEFGMTRDGFTASPNNTQTVYGLSVSWSPFQRHTGIMAERDRTRAARLAAEAELSLAERAVDREVDAGLERLARAKTLAERSELNVRLAERQRMQAEERYRLGLATILERVTADALWADAMRQQAIARYAALRAVAGIELATGARLRDTPRDW